MPQSLQAADEPVTARLMRAPRSLSIELTARCNLRCHYCYFFNNPAMAYQDVPTGEWLTFFDELGSLGVMNVTLAGGEPFIREDLPALLDGVVRNRMRFSFLSNGTLITDDIAAYIVRTGRCDYVQVSVDGASAPIHDSCRGKGTFEGAIRGIRILQRHGIYVAVRVTIHRNNVHDLDAIARFLLVELGLPSFGTNAAGYIGNCREHAQDVLLTVPERMEAIATLLRLAEQYPGRIAALAGPLTDGRMWRRMESARATGAPPFRKGGHLTACGCPTNKLSVRADGAIIPCSMLAEIELGRINRDSLLDVWQNSPALNQLRDRHTIPLTTFPFCAGCSYVPYCTGNCPGLAYTLTGTINHPSPDACLRKFLKEGGSIP